MGHARLYYCRPDRRALAHCAKHKLRSSRTSHDVCFLRYCSIALRAIPTLVALFTMAVNIACAAVDGPFGSATAIWTVLNAPGTTLEPGKPLATAWTTSPFDAKTSALPMRSNRDDDGGANNPSIGLFDEQHVARERGDPYFSTPRDFKAGQGLCRAPAEISVATKMTAATKTLARPPSCLF
jgi:hypothetical protein